MSCHPDTTIDYIRPGALPFAQLPGILTDLQKATWFDELDAYCNFLIYRNFDEPPDDRELNPHNPKYHRVRVLDIVNSADKIMIQRDWPPGNATGLEIQTQIVDSLTDTQVDNILYSRRAVGSGETPAEFAARTAGKVYWDSYSSDSSALPIPMLTDESMLVFWKRPIITPSYDILDEMIPGVFDRLQSPIYILSTSITGRDGELDRLLLRAPTAGLFRFDRYQHIVLKDTGELKLRRRSRSGRIIIQTVRMDIFPDLSGKVDPWSHLRRNQILVFENVDTTSVVNTIGGIIADQLFRFDSLISDPYLKIDRGGIPKKLHYQLGWLMRVWLAIHEHDATVAPIPQELTSELRGLISVGVLPPKPQLSEALSMVISHPEGCARLFEFIRQTYSKLIVGYSLNEIGIAVPDDASYNSGDLNAYSELVAFNRMHDRWLPCFAGCPLGRPARLWARSAQASNITDALAARQSGWTEYQVEALYQARYPNGNEGDPISSHQNARNAGVITDDQLLDYAEQTLNAQPVGHLAALRLVEPSYPLHRYTTIDWIKEWLSGITKLFYQEPVVEFDDYAQLGHPLAEVINWTRFKQAWDLRRQLDILDAHKIGEQRLDIKSLTWWTQNTKVADSEGKWPTSWPTAGTDGIRRYYRVGPTPTRPFLSVARRQKRTRTIGKPREGDNAPVLDGFDDFDLEVALRVASIVRDGKSFNLIDPALVLALADREGYLVYTKYNRIPHERGMRFGETPHADFKDTAGRYKLAFLKLYARKVWCVWPYGLDVLNYPRGEKYKVNKSDFMSKSDDWFKQVLEWVTTAVDTEDPQKVILPRDFLSSGSVRLFVQNRLRVRNSSPSPFYARETRCLEWIGLTLQAAIFQWVHRQLFLHTGYRGESYREVAELVDNSIPARGETSNSIERRDYIAYWALVYLGFNASPNIWNYWVDQANASRGSEPLPRHLLYQHDISDIDTTSSIQVGKRTGTRGAMTRFAATLDAYLRFDFKAIGGSGTPDTSNPNERNWFR